ncbi:MAG: ribosome recycling factor [Acidimicrobiia bacterium]|nr:ribosome recycling factor [Acidimicrobiia bacterium]MYC57273.1 ribosome recycling factor [Acidimicrobiia bacterium]MYG94477.1 ribosome recycling factor [Acidimicrobiia bacterium]MYI30937.1 ribosome recycling factor [Acidimicrobiia bacterium]
MTTGNELIDLALEEVGERMDVAVDYARQQFASVRTGRASSALFERFMVDYYGTEVPLNQLASFSVPEAQLLVISPFDKSSIPAIERAITQADIGINPASDGSVVRLAFPPLTEERRRELVKLVKQMAEDGRIAIRNSRRHTRQEIDQLSKQGDISEDIVARANKELDQLTHVREQFINDALSVKEQELLAI